MFIPTINSVSPNHFYGLTQNAKNGAKISTYEKLISDLAKRVESPEVPEYGDFSSVYEKMKNTDETLSATDFILKVVQAPITVLQYQKKRNLEFVAYRLPFQYKSTRVIATGSKSDIIEVLKNPELAAELEKVAKTLSKSLEAV